MHKQFIEDIMNCETTHQIDQVVFQYCEFLDDNRGLYTLVKSARRRIHNLRREIKKTYQYQLN